MKLTEVYKDKVMGAIKGLDRIRFRGTLRWLASERGINTYAYHAGILLKDFAKWAEKKTGEIRLSCESRAHELGVPIHYLRSSGIDKEAFARRIMKEQGIRSDGSICMISVVEPCMSPTVAGNKESGKLELIYRPRKCTHIYHYFDHPEVGFGHVRIQSWLPFGVSLCLNGRHWLEKQLKKKGIGYVKDGNCFKWLQDMETAQKMFDEQLKSDWPELLSRLVLNSCPELPGIISPMDFNYYWSADETEWATDIMFKQGGLPNKLPDILLRHAMIISDSPAVMRYLGRGNAKGTGGQMPEEVVSDCRRRYEGVRVKHWINNNSIKVYNKSATLLRIETTINSTREFKVYRSPNDDPDRSPSWQHLRKGVSDLHRRCEISNNSNERYGQALAAALVQDKFKEVLEPVCRSTIKSARSYRALNPWSSEDYKMLSFLSKGEFAINGFRNKDLRRYLYGNDIEDKIELKRRSARVSRHLGLLRAHGIIRKVPKVNRYVLTDKGLKISTALLGVSSIGIDTIMDLAA